MARKTITKASSSRKKKWFPVLAPKMFDNQVIGETHQFEAEEAVGNTLEANLMTLTRNIRNQNVNLKFLITDEKSGKLTTKIKEYSLINSSLKRLVRRKHDRLDSSLVLTTSDGVKVRIKVLAITRNKVKGSVKTAIIKELESYVTDFVTKNSYESVFHSVIFYKIQRSLKEKLDKVYPLKYCEVRVIKQIKGGADLKDIEEKDTTAKPEKKPEAEEKAEESPEEEEETETEPEEVSEPEEEEEAADTNKEEE